MVGIENAIILFSILSGPTVLIIAPWKMNSSSIQKKIAFLIEWESRVCGKKWDWKGRLRPNYSELFMLGVCKSFG